MNEVLKMGFIKGLLLSVVFAFVATKFYRAIWFLKPGMPIFEHRPGPCHVVPRVEGSEDMAMLPGGQVLISSGLRFRTEKFPERKGKILLFDFKKPKMIEDLDIIWNSEDKFFKNEFNPHGIDALTKGGKTYVYVINHDPHEAVERFSLDLKKMTLTHLESIRDPAMHEMNSVMAIDERSFFFTNFAYFPYKEYPLLAKIEFSYEWGSGSIGSYDGKTSKGQILKSGYHLPNGIALSKNKKKLYMADIGNLAMVTFDIHSISNITVSHTLNIETVIDNIQMDPSDGSLWLGCQPSAWSSIQYLSKPDELISASQVVKVKVGTDGNPTEDIVEVYRNGGEEISLSTVALHYQKKTLIGSLYHNLVMCEIKNM